MPPLVSTTLHRCLLLPTQLVDQHHKHAHGSIDNLTQHNQRGTEFRVGSKQGDSIQEEMLEGSRRHWKLRSGYKRESGSEAQPGHGPQPIRRPTHRLSLTLADSMDVTSRQSKKDVKCSQLDDSYKKQFNVSLKKLVAPRLNIGIR